MKKLIALITLSLLLVASIGMAYSSTIFDVKKIKPVPMKIYYKDKEVSLKDPVNPGDYLLLTYNNRTYVPARLIGEVMGADGQTMWSSTAPLDIRLNPKQPEGYVPEEQYKSLQEQYSKLEQQVKELQEQKSVLEEQVSSQAERISALEADNAKLQSQTESLGKEVSTQRQRADEMERQYNIIVNTDNVVFPYFRIYTPVNFIIDKTSFLSKYDWDKAAEIHALMGSQLVTDLLKRYCDASSIRINQGPDAIYISGASNATMLRNVREIQEVVDRLGLTIAFQTPADGRVYYYPSK